MGNSLPWRSKVYEIEPVENDRPVSNRHIPSSSPERVPGVLSEVSIVTTTTRKSSSKDLNAEIAFQIGENKRSASNDSGIVVPTRASKLPRLLSLKEVREVTTNILRSRIYGCDKSPKELFRSLFPQILLLSTYRLRWIPYDVAAGLIVAMIHFTQEFATAMTASMAPYQGLYISIFPGLVYACMTTSPHNSLGAMPVIAAVIGVSLMTLQNEYFPDQKWPNGTVMTDQEQWNLHLDMASGVSLIAGIILLTMGILKMGFMVSVLSPVVMEPFGLACMLQSICAQFPTALGVRPPVRFTYGKHFRDIIYLLTNWRSIDAWETLISVTFAGCVLTFREFLQPIIYQKSKTVVPIEFIMFGVAVALSYSLNLQKRLGIRILGPFTYGLPAPSIPDYDYGALIWWEGFVNAIVSYSVTLGAARTLARKSKENISSNQELLALGSAHIFGSFFSCFTVAAPMGRGIINQSMGSRSQISNIVGALFLALIVAFTQPAISYLPRAVVSTTIILFLAMSLKGFSEFPKLWKSNKLDAFIWAGTFIISISVNVHIGLMMGLGMSILGLILRTQSPKVRILGRLKNSNGFVPLKYYDKAEELVGVRIIQINSPLHYGNAQYIVHEIENLATEYVVTEKITDENQQHPSSSTTHESRYRGGHLEAPDNLSASTSNLSRRNKRPRMKSSHNQTVFQLSERPGTVTIISQEFILVGAESAKISRVILDLGTVGYIDVVGIRALEQLASDLKIRAVELILAQCKGPLLKQLKELEVQKVIPERNIFPSLVNAVEESVRRIRIKTIPAQGTVQEHEDSRFWDMPIVPISGLPLVNYNQS